MPDEEPLPVIMTATCRTPDCPMDGVGIVAPFYANSTPPIYRGQCAQCEQPVTDLVPVWAT